MTDRQFNIRTILAGNTARFQRVTYDDVFYYVWVANDDTAIVHRSPMRMYEFPVNRADLKSIGPLQAAEPADKLAPFIALAIQQKHFVEVT